MRSPSRRLVLFDEFCFMDHRCEGLPETGAFPGMVKMFVVILDSVRGGNPPVSGGSDAVAAGEGRFRCGLRPSPALRGRLSQGERVIQSLQLEPFQKHFHHPRLSLSGEAEKPMKPTRLPKVRPFFG